MCPHCSGSTAEKPIRGWGGKERLPREENTAAGERGWDGKKTLSLRGQPRPECGIMQVSCGHEVKPREWEDLGDKEGQI